MKYATLSDWQRLWQTLAGTGVFGARPALGLGRLAATALRHGPTPYALVAWHAATQPNESALEAPDGRLTYRELLAQADALAAQLATAIPAGSRVGLLGRGGAHWLVGLLAATRLGAEVVLMNTLHSSEGWATQARKLRLVAILHEAAYAEGLRQHPHPADLVELGRTAQTGFRFMAPRLGSVTLLTSGSTGNPRAIRRRTGLSRSLAVCAANDFLTRIEPRRGERVWLPPPLFHGHGLSALMLTLGFGGTLILADAEDLWASLEAADPHWAVLVPTMLHRLLESRPAAPTLPHLRRLVSGSAPLSPRLAHQAQAQFGPVLFNLYGTTETGPIALATPADLAASVNVGRVLRGVHLDLAHETVNVRSPFLAVNAASWNTGDLATVDAAGRLHLRGRADDRLICGGENVDPEELENRIELLAGVRECALWGESDAEYGQVIHALIVPEAGVGRVDLQTSLEQALPRTLRPRSVTLCSELPRNAAGKLLRRELQSLKN